VAWALHHRKEKSRLATQRYRDTHNTPEDKKKRVEKQKEYMKRPGMLAKKKAYDTSLEAKAKRRLKRTGITAALFEILWRFQNGRCAICERDLVERATHADHCHDTKQPRGLLCFNCNVIEGAIKKVGLTPSGFSERLERYLNNPPASVLELV